MLWFDDYKPSTVSTRASGLWSCSINNSIASLWCSSLSSSATTPFSFPYTFSSLKRPPVFSISLYFGFLYQGFALLLPVLLATLHFPGMNQETPDSCTSHLVFCHRFHFVYVHVRRAWGEPSQVWICTHCRRSQTLHLSLQQLLPWRTAATARWQRPYSEPREHVGEPRALCLDTHIYHQICWSRTAALPPARFFCCSVLAFYFYSRQLCSMKSLGRI